MHARPGDPHCLVVTKLVPLPADNGGKLRTLALLRRLVDAHPVTVVAFDEGDADVEGIRDLGATVITAPWRHGAGDLARGLAHTGSATSARFWNRWLATTVRRIAADHPSGSILLEYVQLAPWVRHAPARQRILASHNVESELVRSYAGTASGPRRAALRLEAGALRRAERRVLREVDVVSVVSARDRGRLGPTSADVIVCPNGIDPAPAPAWGREPAVAFVAQLGWAPNADAAVWLGRDVWPLVEAAVPDARLLLVGRNPTPDVRALAGPQIEVTGTVPAVRPYLERARVAVAPLRAGGGTRLKILEALAAGRPVVATSIGAEGLDDLIGDGIVLADDPTAMARAIAWLLEDEGAARHLGMRGRAAVLARYSWDATLAPLLAACA